MNRDWQEFIESFNARGVEYIVVGAHALAYYGHPRYTGDLDLFVRPTRENAERIALALADFSFSSLGLAADDFLAPGRVVQLGVAPFRIDLLNWLDGLSFEEAWTTREHADLGGVQADVLSRDCLIRNKRATGRLKDLADVEALEGDGLAPHS